MGINLRILYYDLMDFGPELQSDRPLCECPLTYFSFYNGRPLTDPGCLYIVKPEQLAEVAENTPCSFLCLGEPQRHELGGSVSVLWFRDESRFLELLSKLSEIFHSYMDWLNALELAVAAKSRWMNLGGSLCRFFGGLSVCSNITSSSCFLFMMRPMVLCQRTNTAILQVLI